jgi:hypothetical protein
MNEDMRKDIAFFLLMCVTFYACEDKNPQEIASEPVPEMVSKQILVNYQNCNTDSLSCTYAIITYPHFTDSSNSVINTLLDDKIMLLTSDFSKKGSQHASLEDIAVAFVNDYETFKNDFSDYELGWYLQISSELIYHTEQLISFKIETGTFTGGAHPNSSTNYFVYDLQSKKELSTKNIISDTTQFKQILEQAFREQSGLEAGQSFADAGFYINDGDFVLNDNIGITEDAVIVHFNAYEIAPYALGPTTIELKREKIEKILKVS